MFFEEEAEAAAIVDNPKRTGDLLLFKEDGPVCDAANITDDEVAYAIAICCWFSSPSLMFLVQGRRIR